MTISQLCSIVISASFAVHNTLGVGYSEHVYIHALHHELTLRGIDS